jgi:hypothetical protein
MAFLRGGINDGCLPLCSSPSWAKARPLRKVFKLFSREQWMFCPFSFSKINLLQRLLDPREILPIEVYGMDLEFDETNHVRVQCFKIHDGYNHLKTVRGRKENPHLSRVHKP